VTKLIQRMREELIRRNYAETTIRSYLQAMEDFRRFAPKRLDHLGPDEIRKYQVHLLEERKLEVGTVAYRVAALRFFYVRTLKRPAMKEDLPYPHAPKHTRRLPTILTPEEVSRLIDSARNLFHYAMLFTMYSAGLRRSELCKLKVSNIDSGRMVLRIERGRAAWIEKFRSIQSCSRRYASTGVGCVPLPICSLAPAMAGALTSRSRPR
jgi:integrase/recombinase XerD